MNDGKFWYIDFYISIALHIELDWWLIRIRMVYIQPGNLERHVSTHEVLSRFAHFSTVNPKTEPRYL